MGTSSTCGTSRKLGNCSQGVDSSNLRNSCASSRGSTTTRFFSSSYLTCNVTNHAPNYLLLDRLRVHAYKTDEQTGLVGRKELFFIYNYFYFICLKDGGKPSLTILSPSAYSLYGDLKNKVKVRADISDT